MVSLLLVILGLVVTFGILIDVIRTVFSVEGAGWLTSLLNQVVGRVMIRLKPDGRRPRWLLAVGPLLIVSIGVCWVIGLWLALTCLLLADSGSIVHGSSGAEAGLLEKLYFAGYAISTMGNGEFEPTADVWRLLAVVYSLFGFGLMTSAIAYFIPVLSAVMRQEKLAVSISLLGGHPVDLLRFGWGGSSFEALEEQASALFPMVIRHSRSHLAYPVIQHFINTQRRLSITLNLAILDEAVNLVLMAGRPEVRKSVPLILLRRALDDFLRTVSDPAKQPTEIHPYALDEEKLGDLAAALDLDRFRAFPENHELASRRAALARLLHRDGWRFSDIGG